MKPILFIISSLLLLGGMSLSAQTYNIHKADGTVATFPAAEVEFVDFVDTTQDNAPAEAEAVDLGLPSGLLWANMNVGAKSISDLGLHFAWGETTGYASDGTHSFEWANYTLCDGDYNKMNRYCVDAENGIVDNITTLLPSDDAATANWGGRWRMPTREEVQELIDNCDSRWVRVNGVTFGRQFLSRVNDNYIFIPAAGYMWGTYLYGDADAGQIWTSTLYQDETFSAYYLGVGTEAENIYELYRFVGLQVRPVCTK